MLRIFKNDNCEIECVKNLRIYSSLPDDYIIFLNKYNGGDTPKTTFRLNKISSDIRFFYGFTPDEKYKDITLLFLNSDMINLIDDGYFPIAEDSFGNYILLGLTSKTGVYFFDHETQKITKLADSFSLFVKAITSKKFQPKSIEERISKMKDVGSTVEVTPELMKMWKSEIDKYGGRKQLIVNLDE